MGNEVCLVQLRFGGYTCFGGVRRWDILAEGALVKGSIAIYCVGGL